MAHACVSYAGRDLPVRIQRAISRLMDPAFPIDLTAAEKVALAALLRRVEKRDGLAAFWVLRANLAEMFGRVERTISNWLCALEDKGLIEKEQRRSRWGNFACVTVHLSDQAAALLGLLELSPSPAPDQPKNISSGHKEAFTREQSYQRQQASPVDKSTKVPEDLRLLLDLGIRPSGVFKLMSRAKTFGKRLSDVVAESREALEGSRAAFGFLWDLLQRERLRKSPKVLKPSVDPVYAALLAKKKLLHERYVFLPSGYVACCKADDVVTLWHHSSDGRLEYVRVIAGTELHKFWARAVEMDYQPAVAGSNFPAASCVATAQAAEVRPTNGAPEPRAKARSPSAPSPVSKVLGALFGASAPSPA